MPKMSQAKVEEKLVKMLFIGDSGTGKTGALASLVRAGYKIKIVDFDNGTDILPNVLADEPELLDNIDYLTCTDKWKAVGNFMIPSGAPKAWSNALKIIGSGKCGDENWGDPAGWGSETVLVIDSLTKAGIAAMLNVLQINGRLMEQPYQSDWGEAQRILSGLINCTMSSEYKCHVIFNTHINYIELKEGLVKGFPSTVGKKLSQTIGQDFNIVLQAYTKGIGKAAQRRISALPQGAVDTKAAMLPSKLPESWSIETGLAEFFKLFLGEKKA